MAKRSPKWGLASVAFVVVVIVTLLGAAAPPAAADSLPTGTACPGAMQALSIQPLIRRLRQGISPTLKPAENSDLLHQTPVQMQTPLQTAAAHWDWQTQGVVTPIKDQNRCGTCWVHATLSAIESNVPIAVAPLDREASCHNWSPSLSGTKGPSFGGTKSPLTVASYVM